MLKSDSAAIEAVIHPSFSRFFEAPYSDHIPFQDGPEVSFNGEVSTFIAVPVKRNDRLLSANVGSGQQLGSPGNFMSLLRSMNKSSHSGGAGSAGGLKPSSMRFLDFKRALLPSMLAAVRNMHPEVRQNDTLDSGAEAASRNVSSRNLHPDPMTTDAAAQSELLLADEENVGPEDDDQSSVWNVGKVEQEEEERIRGQLLRTTGLLLPTETQWYLLNELRIHAGAPERSEAGIERLSHYYAQLLHLEPKFPFETDEIQMKFLWYEGFFPDRKVVTNCIQYEKAAVLYNVAAVYTTLAISQSLWTPNGKKKAAGYFQKGAGVLCHIRDRLCARFKPKLDKGSDLSEPTLTAAAEIMLAQAMECFYEKATDTKASSAVTAKIAAQTADFYDVALRAAKSPTGLGKNRFPELWINHIRAKTNLFSAIAHMHTGPASAAEAAVGERIARVSLAKDLIEKAVKASKENGGALYELVQGHAQIITTAYSFLIHANFERHHHPTYDDRLLPPLRRPLESLVSATPLEQSITDMRNFTDIFHAIMSPTNHIGVKQVLDDCDDKIEAGRKEMMSCLASLGLPFGEDPSVPEPERVSVGPQALQEKADVLLNEISECASDEDAFPGIEMLDSLNTLIEFSGLNLKESFSILDHQDVSSSSSCVAARQVAIACNAKIMETTAHYTDLKRKWDGGVGDIIGYSEEDIKTLLPFGGTGLLVPDTESNPQLDAAVKERVLLLRKVEGLRKLCEDHMQNVARLDRPDDLGLVSTSVSIDVHSAIQSRHEQLRVVEDTIKMIHRDKDGLLSRIEHLSDTIKAASNGRLGLQQTEQVVQKLLKAIAQYKAWRSRLEENLQQSGLRYRQDTCHLLSHASFQDPLIKRMLDENLEMESPSDPKPETPPYNPDAPSASTLTRLVHIRSALVSSGVTSRNPAGHLARPMSKQPDETVIEDKHFQNGWKHLFESQKETLAQLLVDKAQSDLALSKIQEMLAMQQIQHEANHDHPSRIITPSAPVQNRPLPDPVRPTTLSVKRKPVFPSQVGGNERKVSSSNVGQPKATPTGPNATEKLRQIMRFVSGKRDSQASLGSTQRDAQGSSDARAFSSSRNISSVEQRRSSGAPTRERRPLPQPSGAGIDKPRHSAKSTGPIRHGTDRVQQQSPEDDPHTDQLLAELSLADYDISRPLEKDLRSMLPVESRDDNLPSRLDDIYTRIRALMLSQDALRKRNANEMREALDTILENYQMRVGGVDDSMSRWTQRQMEDARARLTDALDRVDREDQRETRGEGKEASRKDSRKHDNRASASYSREIGDHRQMREAGEQRSRRDHAVENDQQHRHPDARRSHGHDDRVPEQGRSNPVQAAQNINRKGKQRSTEEPRLGESSRVNSWVEEQRRMSLGSGAGSTAGRGHPVETYSQAPRYRDEHKQQSSTRERAREDEAYERIASAAAAAAAAGVSAAFRYSDDREQEDTWRSEEPIGRSSHRREPQQASVTFNVREPREEPAIREPRHAIRRKPSGGAPIVYEHAQRSHQDDFEGHHHAGDGWDDGNVAAAAAAEPMRRSSNAKGRDREQEGYNHSESDIQVDSGRFKEQNDLLAREFLAEETVGERVARFERERRSGRQRR
ncbi:hypothetical protein HKX48_003267 [Thoreauomyces humboldtii]|nr:hypothetical protein HKX48_003267 [Thoreauomyces humboldtii]